MNYNPSCYAPQMGHSLSRQPSMGYAGSAYPHQMYPSGVAASEPAYHMYPPPGNTLVPASRRSNGAGYDNYTDPYYHDRQRTISRSASVAPMVRSRSRRQSTFAAPPHALDAYRPPSSAHIKFRRKGTLVAGIGLNEAQSRGVRLSGNDSYRFRDLHADSRGRIYLKIQWAGYSPLTYEIPLDGYDDRVDLGTLARRVSRACVHYLQASVIPIPWDRVQLHHLEEVSYGVWQPMLSAL